MQNIIPPNIVKMNGINWDNTAFTNSEKFAKLVSRQYNALIKEISKLAIDLKVDDSKPFSFDDYPSLKKKIDKLFSRQAAKITAIISEGIWQSYQISGEKTKDLMSGLPLTKELIEAYQKRGEVRAQAAYNAYLKNDKSTISDRVWEITNQTKGEIELSLSAGLSDAKSAAQLSRDINQYLNNPNALFRRVRDKYGNLVLSQAAKNYHPGQGVYRSSSKNALRLTRTEINMAYRTSDLQRWSELDFVVGYEIRLSTNPKHCPVCVSLAGRYPKTFKWRGWHPQCRCYMVPILMTDAEFEKLNAAVLNGEDLPTSSVNSVKGYPKGFTDFLSENKASILAAKTKPYFITDNADLLDINKIKQTIKVVNNSVAGNGPNSNPTTPVIPKFTPSNLADYEKEYGTKIDNDIFSYLSKETELIFKDKIKGSFYSPSKNTVNIAPGDRTKTPGYTERVIYHEYGHAIDWQNDIRKNPEITNLMYKYRMMNKAGDNKGIFAKWDSLYRQEVSALFKNPDLSALERRSLSEQLGSFADTLMSLNKNYGYGHTKSYFSNSGFPEAEFIAHSFENLFQGNEVFKRIAPELYEDTISVLKSILSKIKKS